VIPSDPSDRFPGRAALPADAVLAAQLLVLDPFGLSGICLRGAPSARRDAWIDMLRGLMPRDAPFRRVPPVLDDEAIFGGLDLASSLLHRRPVMSRGLLEACDGGAIVLAMAERVSRGVAARLSGALDGMSALSSSDTAGHHRRAPHFMLVALDEGMFPEETMPAALRDRLAFHIDLDARASILPPPSTEEVPCRDDEALAALCGAALSFGILSLRAPVLALRAARAAAMLSGRSVMLRQDLDVAARLVLAPRALALPAPDAADLPQSAADPPQADGSAAERVDDMADAQDLEDRIVEAARAALPAQILAGMAAQASRAPGTLGRSGASRIDSRRGAPMGSRPGRIGGGSRIALIDTMRAAAPWQRLRRPDPPVPGAPRLALRRGDIRIKRFRQRRQTTTIFVVDASGSTALHRLAEAKGAVELLLSECYVRRDLAALIVVRGSGAELVLPPTASLTRAKRRLSGLPGGGGTPLAAGLDRALLVALQERRIGRTPSLVILTDARPNVARDGRGDRGRAEAESIEAGRALCRAGIAGVLIDTASRSRPFASELAAALGVRLVPLPFADAAGVGAAIRGVPRSSGP
jgi:magnesium chelatase subunit D